MSKIYKFSGYSDDIFAYECSDGTGDEQDNCNSGSPMVWKLESEDGSLFVVGHYAPNDVCACWSVGLCPVGEDIQMPKWPTKFYLRERGYSAELEIEVPDDTKITCCEKS